MSREREEGLDYFIISAFSPAIVKALPQNEAFDLVGLYSEGNFKQPVPCKVCESPLFVSFNSFQEPVHGQCFECNSIFQLYYTDTRNFYVPWKEGR